jgi:SAM-dependent methyltransferase
MSERAIGEDVRTRVMQQAQGAMALQIAFIAVTNGLFEALGTTATVSDLAARTRLDAGYLQRWCDAAYAFGYLDCEDARYVVTELGRAFAPSAAGTLMPFAVGSVLGAHMTERAAGLMRTGERPGERVLAERETILPMFGPMLEASFAGLFAREIMAGVPAFAEANARAGLVVDLGCGNGWYLRALAAAFPALRGLGLDGFEENVRQAEARAASDGHAARLTFRAGDIYGFRAEEPADVVAMNRALHHVWDQKEKVFGVLRDALRPGGAAVIWEPAWPREQTALREPRRRAMAFQNLNEHVQGNHFLRPDEIEEAFRAVGMRAETRLFAEGTEAVVIGVREG